jgi:predicted AlkP superfamily phosphohydrolase/phosphomutase
MTPFLQFAAAPSLAYIGPGAGFAVMGSFLILLAAIALGVLTLLTLPFRLLLALLRKAPKGMFKRVVIVGFDGMDPRRATRLMDVGRMPHLAALRDTGTFSKLGSTCPPMSPVAWSTFSTGVNPGKHGIYDFLSRDLRTCLPELSSARIAADAKGRAHAIALRKSRPFWALLGDHGIFSTILRVPITFPVEPFNGLCLSAMCAPDIRGTQGEFTLFDGSSQVSAVLTSGLRIPVAPVARGTARRFRAILPGPTLKGKPCTLAVKASWRTDAPGKLRLTLAGKTITLEAGTYSPWVRLTFRRGLTRVRAIARLLLVSTEPDLKLYVTPLNIDPEQPSLPIAWPSAFSVYLAKRHGPFATLGLAEDTWALTGGAIGEAAFLKQVNAIHDEREAMFFNALRLTRRGVCVCVFDLTDRVQHTFMRGASRHGTAVPDDPIDAAYIRCDQVIGRLRRKLGEDDLLFVLSDHGFTTFERGVNLNAWLREAGYLVEKKAGDAAEYLCNVDWSKTRAYSFGLTGLYLNLRGREAHGIVEPGAEAEALKAEIAAKLTALRDPERDRPVTRRIYDAARIYHGPYTLKAPDLVCGWHSGYRHSWETAVGRTDGPVLADNPSHWCGDHCVDRDEVPGVLFCNRRLDLPDRGPHLLDFAPTLLSLWHLPLPGYLDGVAWRIAESAHHEEHEGHEDGV